MRFFVVRSLTIIPYPKEVRRPELGRDRAVVAMVRGPKVSMTSGGSIDNKHLKYSVLVVKESLDWKSKYSNLNNVLRITGKLYKTGLRDHSRVMWNLSEERFPATDFRKSYVTQYGESIKKNYHVTATKRSHYPIQQYIHLPCIDTI
ncbi:hypothetical protein J6590_031574 [Homalodisca vitripennis]|nr:hypothetical protein J6590_031574 [Homalodisca vitripennis]